MTPVSGAAPPAGEFVARQVYDQWRDERHRGALAAPRRALARAAWYANTVLACAKQVARHGPGVRELTGMSLPAQFARVLCFSIGNRLWPLAWYRYRFYLPGRAGSERRYLYPHEASRLLVHINDGPDMPLLVDKHLFGEACARHGLAHIPAVAAFADGRMVAPQPPLDADALPREDLFVKVTNLMKGEGAERWVWRAADGVYESHDGRRLTPADLLAQLARQSREKPCVVQRRLTNHAALAGFTNGALSTLRIVTAKFPGGEPRVLVGAFRMACGRGHVDNFSAGGIASPVDLASGRLGPALTKNPSGPPVTEHPDTRHRIDGEIMPFWSEARELCLAAHRSFPTMAAVGWDVALTPDGPVLVEANPVWSPEVVQISHGVPLADLGFNELAAAHVAHKAGKATVGPPKPDRPAPPSRRESRDAVAV